MNKKILLVTSEFPPLPGGIGNHAFHLANNLSEKGYDIQVVTDQRGDKQEEQNFDDALQYSVKRIALNKGVRLLTYLQRILFILKHSRRSDIIIASGKFSLWSVSWIRKILKRKTLAVVHGTEVNFTNPLLSKTTNKALKSFDTIVPVSNYTKSLLEDLDLKHVRVIPNGYFIDQGAIQTIKKKKADAVQLITVGSVTDRKGQENVIRALPEIISTGMKVHYHMAGTPKERDRLSEMAIQLKVDKNITFHGIVSEQEKYNLLQESDIFVMLSNQTASGDVEGFGIALIEANYFGVPAIGATNCGIEDAVSQENSGILVDAKDSDAVVKAIVSIMENYEEYRTNAKKWSDNFTWREVIKSYIELIEE